eukprot:gb/GEZN01008022.1/.p1 GENE.gb/GEZN01008022.1/~~gb/GEZN01008022.1/.p1  ORF type:complete len:333 (-),score=53.89 gb/GEZN01008022.1/:323-1321(-)
MIPFLLVVVAYGHSSALLEAASLKCQHLPGRTTRPSCLPPATLCDGSAGSCARVLRWELLSWPCFEQLRQADMSMIVVLPVGSTEQHGPHLPLATDTLLLDALLDVALCELVQREVVLRVAYLRLETVRAGASFEHQAFPGTLSIQDRNLNGFWRDLVDSVVLVPGVTKLVLVNSHGGQTANAEILTRDLRFSYPELHVVSVNLQAMFNASKFGHKEAQFGIHAGAVETSLMQFLYPELVNQEQLRNFASAAQTRLSSGSSLDSHGRAVAMGWQTQDLNVEGAVGDASLATAEHGACLFNQTVRQLRQVLLDFAEYSHNNNNNNNNNNKNIN